MDVDDQLTAYEEAFERRRQAKSTGAAFTAAEPNALLAIHYAVNSRSGESATLLKRRLSAVTALTSGAVVDASEHHLAVDLAGVAWAEAFGVLPLDDVPQAELEWTLVSGSVPRAVAGIYGVCWRTRFLLTAWPYFNARHRAAAITEVDRRLAWLADRVGGPDTDLPLSAACRVAWLAAGVAETADHAALRDGAARLVAAHVAADVEAWGPGTPTAHLAQAALAATAVGAADTAASVVAFMVDRRADERTGLLGRADGDLGPEMSPWVPLALGLTRAVTARPVQEDRAAEPAPRAWRWRGRGATIR